MRCGYKEYRPVQCFMRCSYQICSVRIFSTKEENPNEGGFLVLEHDGGEDGDGEGDHGKVATNLLVVPHLQQSVKVVLGIVQKDDILLSVIMGEGNNVCVKTQTKETNHADHSNSLHFNTCSPGQGSHL